MVFHRIGKTNFIEKVRDRWENVEVKIVGSETWRSRWWVHEDIGRFGDLIALYNMCL